MLCKQHLKHKSLYIGTGDLSGSFRFLHTLSNTPIRYRLSTAWNAPGLSCDSPPLWGTSWDCVAMLRTVHAVYKSARNHTVQIPHMQGVWTYFTSNARLNAFKIFKSCFPFLIFLICKDYIKLVIFCVCVYRTIRSFLMRWRMGTQRHSSNSELLLAH